MTAAPITLLLGACQYPPGLFDRTSVPTTRWRHALVEPPQPGPADLTRVTIQQWARAHGPPDACLWAGDWIYIDATAGLLDPLSHDAAHALRSRRAALESAYLAADGSAFRLPGRWLHAIDDHEIRDNWEPSAHPQRNRALAALCDEARAAFLESSAADHRPGGGATLWFATRIGAVPLFVADTRTERDVRADPRALHMARIMGTAQWQALHAALEQAGQTGSGLIVLCGSIVLPRRLATAQHPAAALRSDGWDGYPSSLYDLLASLAEHRVPGCLLLSGDEHLACATDARVERLDDASYHGRFWSVHAGAAYAPYPFANGRWEDFADERSFDFTSTVSGSPRHYRCTLQTVFAPAHSQGFISVRYTPPGPGAAACPRVVWHAAAPGGPASYPLLSPAGLSLGSSTV